MRYGVWGFPVFKYAIDDPDTALKEILTSINKNTLRLTKGEWNADSQMFTTKDDHEMKYLNQQIQMYLRTMLSELTIPVEDFTLNECGNSNCKDSCKDYWINIYSKGQYQGEHWHMLEEDEIEAGVAHPMFSFTYFAKYDPEKDAKFVFVNPSPSGEIYGDWINTVPAFEPEFKPDIAQGDILIFPSFLVHRVEEQAVDTSRITLSGNIYKTTNEKKCI
jgi:hypothetical protein